MLIPTADLGPPADYEEVAFPAGISNDDFTVEDGVEDRLRNEKVFTGYASWNFYGVVWFNAEGSFSCQVRRYGSVQGTFQADTLDALMHEVSGEYGYD